MGLLGGRELGSTDYIEVAGNRIAFRLDGNPQGAPILFSNSLASDHSMWDDQVAALSGRYKTIRYDTRGHGASVGVAGDYSIRQLAGDAVALLDHLHLQSVHFIGLSLGGMIGQVLGAEHSARIRSLTLCDTICKSPPGIWDQRIETARSQGMTGLSEATLARWFTPRFGRANSRRLALVREMIERTSPNGYMGCAAAIRDMSLCPLLDSIRAPTLVLVGAEDIATPVSEAERLHEAIAGSSLTVIANAAHLSNLEQPEFFNAAISTFLNESEEALVAE